MELIILIALTIAVFLGFAFMRKQSSMHKESVSKAQQWFLYLGAIIFAFLAYSASAAIEGGILVKAKNFLANLNTVQFYAMHALFIASVEESIKCICFCTFLALYIKGHFETTNRESLENEGTHNVKRMLIQDTAFIFALFFACFENAAYVLEGNADVIIRFCTATVIHIGLALFYDTLFFKRKRFFPLLILIHAAYNFSHITKPLFLTVGTFTLFLCAKKIVTFFSESRRMRS